MSENKQKPERNYVSQQGLSSRQKVIEELKTKNIPDVKKEMKDLINSVRHEKDSISERAKQARDKTEGIILFQKYIFFDKMVEHLGNILEEIRLIQRQLNYLLSDLKHIQDSEGFQKDITFYEDEMKVSMDIIKEHHLLLQILLDQLLEDHQLLDHLQDVGLFGTFRGIMSMIWAIYGTMSMLSTEVYE